MHAGDIDTDDDADDDLIRGTHAIDSSDADWIPSFKDTLDSGDSDFDVDIVDEMAEHDDGLFEWCMRPQAFTPVHMDMDKLAQYYRKSSWNSSSVDFVRSRDNFSGPLPGLKCPQVAGTP